MQAFAEDNVSPEHGLPLRASAADGVGLPVPWRLNSYNPHLFGLVWKHPVYPDTLNCSCWLLTPAIPLHALRRRNLFCATLPNHLRLRLRREICKLFSRQFHAACLEDRQMSTALCAVSPVGSKLPCSMLRALESVAMTGQSCRQSRPGHMLAVSEALL